MKLSLFFVMFLLTSVILAGCQTQPKASEDWLANGSTQERFLKVSKHLRGIDTAMSEAGYRYSELYWAGKDQNWEYAAHQVDKLETTIKNGVERRPKRGASAQMIYPALADVKNAVTAKDPLGFQDSFARLTITCNSCHQVEKAGFIVVGAPTMRFSPIVPKLQPLKAESAPVKQTR